MVHVIQLEYLYAQSKMQKMQSFGIALESVAHYAKSEMRGKKPYH